MTRFLGALLLASGIAVSAAACDATNDSGGYPVYGSAASCSSYATCGTCTPVNGCGWCFVPGGGSDGLCASSPDQCVAEGGEFTWTWNASGCPGAVGVSEAGPGTAGDAGGSGDGAVSPTTDAASRDTGTGTGLEAGSGSAEAGGPDAATHD